MLPRNPRLNHLFIRVDSRGRVVPGSDVLRRSKPKTGDWIDLTNAANICCYTQAILVIQNSNAHAANITAITGDDGYVYAGPVITPGQSVAIPLVNFRTVVYTITTSSGTYTMTAVDGINGATGTITPACTAPAASFAITVTPDNGDQFLVTYTDATTC